MCGLSTLVINADRLQATSHKTYVSLAGAIQSLQALKEKDSADEHNNEHNKILESAVEEAIACLAQLQERLLQELIHQWAQGLQSYLEKLLNNQIDIKVSVVCPENKTEN